MTRKQALELAVQALAENKEAVQVLHTMIDELPLNRWTEAAIRDSVEQFILDNGRPPMNTDFKIRELPPHTVVKRRFGITLQQWLDQNYPSPKPSEEEIRAAVTERFVEDYKRLRPVSAEDYNARRTTGNRGWAFVARCNHTGRWRTLLKKLDLPVYDSRGAGDTPPLKVKVISDTDFRD